MINAIITYIAYIMIICDIISNEVKRLNSLKGMAYLSTLTLKNYGSVIKGLINALNAAYPMSEASLRSVNHEYSIKTEPHLSS